MKKYRVWVEGENLLINHDNTLKKFGFYIYKYVEAQNKSKAEKIAVDLVKNELLDICLNRSSEPPRVSVKETCEIESFESISNLNPGKVWYPEEEI